MNRTFLDRINSKRIRSLVCQRYRFALLALALKLAHLPALSFLTTEERECAWFITSIIRVKSYF